MSDPDQYTCGGRYWLATAGESVFLSFTGAFVFDKIFHLCSDKVAHVHSLGLLPGTGVTVNFFTLASGRMVQIELNQTYFYRLDTYTAGVYSTDCRLLPWTSDALSQGQHTLRITALDVNPAVTEGYVNVHNFVYVSGRVDINEYMLIFVVMKFLTQIPRENCRKLAQPLVSLWEESCFCFLSLARSCFCDVGDLDHYGPASSNCKHLPLMILL